ncbi:CbiX/SirB N-terminal domain-containing protein [Thalassospiraceae bacterium LMO-JJ14]|nr:CbiX/SirB N-terminal domain-containing protein [Thalassospiraceae bacterium LMO-JJ14]
MTTTDTALSPASADRHDAVSVVLAAHGSTRRPDANAVVARHAELMRRTGPFRNVSTAFLMGSGGSAETALADTGTSTVLIVPYMMSDGFLAEALSGQISKSLHKDGAQPKIIVTLPVGTHEGITQIVRHAGERALIRAGFDAGSSTLLLVAHGSKGRPESKVSARVHADRLRNQGGFAAVELAMLEEPPFLDDKLAAIKGPVVVVGLFAAPGGHAVDDVKAAIRRSENTEITDAGPVGVDPRMAEIAVLRALGALNP